MKVPHSPELLAFPESLVPHVWAEMGRRFRNPVTVRWHRGTRIVELLGCARYLVMPTARLVHFAIGTGRRRFRAGRMRDCVVLDPPLSDRLWLAIFAANWLIDQGADVPPHEVDSFIADVRKKPGFQPLLDLARACRLSERLRPRIAEALDLDPRILDWARLGTPFGAKAAVTSNQYSAAWKRAEDFAAIERECPNLLRPYAGASNAGQLGHHDEPVRDLKLAFRRAGIRDAGWKFLITANPRALAAAIPDRTSSSLFEIYCWALRACLAAGQVLPPAVMRRLVMPYGHEPDEAVELSADGRQAPFWGPFLRALARRIDTLEDGAPMQAFLDSEFEDVYDWLEWEVPAIDANQARAGWQWLVSQRQKWEERERQLALARREELRWSVPVPSFALGDYRITALNDAYELWEEGQAMKHCVRMYAQPCSDGDNIVFSIRDIAGRRLATGHIERIDGVWAVESVRLFANRPAGDELFAVAQAYATATQSKGTLPFRQSAADVDADAGADADVGARAGADEAATSQGKRPLRFSTDTIHFC